MPEPPASRLRAAIAALPLTIEAAVVHTTEIAIPSYGEERRPTSTVELSGGGCRGYGEHVGWTADDHRAFGRWAATLPRGTRTLESLHDELAPRRREHAYDCAALESAALDLALHQQAETLASLAGVAHAPLRYVRSFAAPPNPVAAVRGWRNEAPAIGLKLDVEPSWTEDTLAALSEIGGITILDGKLRGTAETAAAWAAAFPRAVLEDPAAPEAVPARLRPRLALDGPVSGAEPVSTIETFRPGHVNLKVPRLGGILPLLDVACTCAALGIAVYFGGMFEVGVGRMQARSLASLLCPDGPNDLAPIPGAESSGLPERIPAAAASGGFGPAA